jgi:hypothetical protein
MFTSMLYQNLMKGLLTALIILMPFGIAVLGEEHTEYTTWMKTNDAASKALQKLEPKTGPEAVRSAERLGAVYENLIGFWRQRNANDAVKWSEEGKAAAAQLASAAHSGNAEKAAAAVKTLEGTCRSCHDAWRMRLPDGKFAIRQERAPARPAQ